MRSRSRCAGSEVDYCTVYLCAFLGNEAAGATADAARLSDERVA